MFEEVTEILRQATRFDFKLLPLYAECQHVSDETQRLLGRITPHRAGESTQLSASPHDSYGNSAGGVKLRKSA